MSARGKTAKNTNLWQVTVGKKRAFCFVFALLLAAFAFAPAQSSPDASPVNATSGVFPLTTKSAEARILVNQALDLYLDRVEQEQANQILRKAIKMDPNFAMAHEFLAQISLDPSEQVHEQKKAYATRSSASAPEQDVIEWYQAASDHKLIAAIPKMNDVLNRYPHDKCVVWMTTWWLMTQNQYQRALDVYERSGITNSPGLMNNMAYNYAYVRQFDKAFALMDQYVAAMPKDPNPLDSYAEILRLAGRYDQSIQHYRAALAINPKFYSSQFGIADTYSVMGNQARARQEYEIGFSRFQLPQLHRVLWKSREATTYVREGDYKRADRAFEGIVDWAHTRRLSQVEADTYRQMAMYQPNPKRALENLERAQVALREGWNATPIELNQELAQLLRARAEIEVKMGSTGPAHLDVLRLAALADRSGDHMIDLAYHGAAGAFLFSEHNYQQAVGQLEEDMNNPLSLKLLAEAYEKTGDHAAARRTNEIVSTFSDPTLEQALVAPQVRKCYPDSDSSCNNNLKNAAYPMHHTM